MWWSLGLIHCSHHSVPYLSSQFVFRSLSSDCEQMYFFSLISSISVLKNDRYQSEDFILYSAGWFAVSRHALTSPSFPFIQKKDGSKSCLFLKVTAEVQRGAVSTAGDESSAFALWWIPRVTARKWLQALPLICRLLRRSSDRKISCWTVTVSVIHISSVTFWASTI